MIGRKVRWRHFYTTLAHSSHKRLSIRFILTHTAKIPMKIYHWLWLLSALLWMAVIFYLSHQPSIPLPPLFPFQDKVFHALVYAILGFCYRGAVPYNSGKTVILAGILGTLYGISDEFHQSFIPGRDASTGDVIADCVGAFAGAAFMQILWQRLVHRKPGIT